MTVRRDPTQLMQIGFLALLSSELEQIAGELAVDLAPIELARTRLDLAPEILQEVSERMVRSGPDSVQIEIVEPGPERIDPVA